MRGRRRKVATLSDKVKLAEGKKNSLFPQGLGMPLHLEITIDRIHGRM
jgi:hypothetical protein